MIQDDNVFDSALIMQLPMLIKAVPSEGRRLVTVEASNEACDSEGDVVLQEALLKGARAFLEAGVLDIDHISEIGHRIGIRQPNEWIVGIPLEVRDIGKGRTQVMGELHKPVPGKISKADELWDDLTRDPPIRWRASIFGYPAGEDGFVDCRVKKCPEAPGATRFVIKSLLWKSLAFTRNPVNSSITGSARVVTAKSYLSALLAKADPFGSRTSPVEITSPSDLGFATEHLKRPSEAQASAGNYPVGHITVKGLDISIETPMGAMRTGKDPSGQEWAVRMPIDYGYVKRSSGADGDHVDVYLGPETHKADTHPVWVVDQKNGDGKFDEHKCLIGFTNESTAKSTYCACFSDGKGADRIGAITKMSFDEFNNWVKSEDTKKPLAMKGPLGVFPIGMSDRASAVEPPPMTPTDIMLPPRQRHELMSHFTHHIQKGRCAYSGDTNVLGKSVASFRNHFQSCCGMDYGNADIMALALCHALKHGG